MEATLFKRGELGSLSLGKAGGRDILQPGIFVSLMVTITCPEGTGAS